MSFSTKSVGRFLFCYVLVCGVLLYQKKDCTQATCEMDLRTIEIGKKSRYAATFLTDWSNLRLIISTFLHVSINKEQ